MKERIFKHWVTTVIGILVIILAVVMFVLAKIYGWAFGALEFGLMLFIGWVFFVAKDSLIKAVFLDRFNIPDPEGPYENPYMNQDQ